MFRSEKQETCPTIIVEHVSLRGKNEKRNYPTYGRSLTSSKPRTNFIKTVVSSSSTFSVPSFWSQFAFAIAIGVKVISCARYLFKQIASSRSTFPSKLTSPTFLPGRTLAEVVVVVVSSVVVVSPAVVGVYSGVVAVS